MKNTLRYIMLITLSLLVFMGCKKGEEDPLISFKSRESRLKGEWYLESGSSTTSTGLSTTTKTFTSSMITITVDGQTNTYSHTEKLEFLKDNVFKSTKIHDNNSEISKGYWAFMEGYGDEISNKECVITRISSLSTPNTIQSFTGDNMPINIMRFKKLTNKELIIEVVGTTTDSESSTISVLKTFYKK